MTELLAKKREKIGKKVKEIREKGLIPAVVYGQKEKAISLEIPEKDFLSVLKEAGESSVVDLKIDGQEKKLPVLIYAIQREPVTGQILHIDFYKVDMKKAITADVALEFTGQSPAVKDEGGVLVTSLKSVEVKSLPTDMPKKILVDISVLESFNDVVYIKDLKIPENVKIIADPETAVVLVKAPKKEKEVVVGEEEGVAESDAATDENQDKKSTEGDTASSEGDGQSGAETQKKAQE